MKQVKITGGLAVVSGIKEFAPWYRKLTFPKYNYGDNSYTNLYCFSRQGDDLLVPRFFPYCNRELGPYSYEVIGSDGYSIPDLQLGEGVELNWRGVDQDKFVAEMISAVEANKLGGYGIAPCGTGKTLMGWELIRRLGRSALVILSLRLQPQQWRTEFDLLYGAGAADKYVGVYQGKRRDTGRSYPFVVATIQTLRKEKRPEFFADFGTVIFDEGHHVPANTWLEMIARLRSRYVFAITASYHRSDKLDKMFRVLLGPTLAEAEADTVAGGCVDMVYLSAAYKTTRPWGQRPNIKQWAKSLGRNEARNQVVLKYLQRTAGTGRKLLVYSGSKAHLKGLFEQYPCEAGLYMGGMTEKALKKSAKQQVTFITYDIGTESLNIPEKDTVVCATPPPSNLKQLKGRIDRALEGKAPPYVLDFVDPNTELSRKSSRREQYWADEGLTVRKFLQH
jgi:superfamily II DNA or RNA helicase